MKKTILFILNKEVSSLPPFMAILDCLCNDYSLKVISFEQAGGRARLEEIYKGRDVKFLSREVQGVFTSLLSRVKRRLRMWFKTPTAWHKEAAALLNTTPHDLLWIAHEETAVEFKKELKSKVFVLNIFELYDIVPAFLVQLKPLAQQASTVIVPEYNRACMLKYWLKLNKIPRVVPNKPYYHPERRFIPNDWDGQFVEKKILLYQGFINRNRNIETICKAVAGLPNWAMVLLGKGEKDYMNYLKEKFPYIIHIEFVKPPHHLDITSWARIGVVKYDWFDLNHAYCAPNKTWEYAGFGIPMIGNELPGLRYSIGLYNAGVLADLDNEEEIRAAIMDIDSHYDEYSNNARTFYNSSDISVLLKSIAKDSFTQE